MGKIRIASGLHPFDYEIHISADTAFILRLCPCIRSVFFRSQKMLPHDHIITSEVAKHPHLFFVKFRNVLCLKSCIYFYLIPVLRLEPSDRLHIFRCLFHGHPDIGYISVLIGARHMIGKSKNFNSHGNRCLNIFSLRIIGMLAPPCMCMIICF